MAIITVKAYDKNNGEWLDIKVNTETEVVRKIDDEVNEQKLAQLMQHPDFDNRYQKAWDAFLDGYNAFDPETGIESRETNCDGHKVSFERRAEVAEK